MKKIVSYFLLTALFAFNLQLTSAPSLVSTAPVRTPRNQVYQFMTQGPGNVEGFLWIPENCTKLRGLLIFSQNVPEVLIAGNSAIRKACADNNLGIFYSAAGFWHGQYGVTVDAQNLQETTDLAALETMLADLAGKSGYPEVATVPWIPIGESMSILMVDGVGHRRPERCIALIYACDIPSVINSSTIPLLGLQGTAFEWSQTTTDIRKAWSIVGNYTVLAKRESQLPMHCLP